MAQQQPKQLTATVMPTTSQVETLEPPAPVASEGEIATHCISICGRKDNARYFT